VSSAGFGETTFGVGSVDRVHLTGERDDYLGERVVSMMLDVGGETLSILLDGYHLTELRKAIQRAEKYLRAGE
jgi:hypothetical protein